MSVIRPPGPASGVGKEGVRGGRRGGKEGRQGGDEKEIRREMEEGRSV